MISLILARAQNGVIGARGALPWHLPDDLRRFKALTLGKPVVMGRKTWASLPRRPLPGRVNIVVTRDHAFAADGAVVVHALAEALDRARGENAKEIMVIGGAEIFAMALPLATRIYLTDIQASPEGDVHFAAPDPAQWHEIAREAHISPDGLPYSYVTLERNRT